MYCTKIFDNHLCKPWQSLLCKLAIVVSVLEYIGLALSEFSVDVLKQGVLADILEPIMGKGLIPADLDTWKVRRRGLLPVPLLVTNYPSKI